MDFHSKSLVILEVFRGSIWDRQGKRKSKSGLSRGMAHYLSLNCGKTMFLLCSNCGTSKSKPDLKQESSGAAESRTNASAVACAGAAGKNEMPDGL
jgi:hypothetical protein